jgi:hypothetical protein
MLDFSTQIHPACFIKGQLAKRREEGNLRLQLTNKVVLMCQGCQYPGQKHHYQVFVMFENSWDM